MPDTRQRNRHPQGDHPRESSKLSLVFEPVQYRRSAKELSVSVLARRGSGPASAVSLQLLVNGNFVDSAITDGENRAHFVVRDLELAPGKVHVLEVRQKGEAVGIRQPYVVQEMLLVAVDTPVIAFDPKITPLVNAHQVTLFLTVTVDGKPVIGKMLDIVGFSNIRREQTDQRGMIEVTERVPFDVTHPGEVQFLPLNLIIEDTGYSATRVLELVPPVTPVPHVVTFSDPEERDVKGSYRVRAIAEDKEGHPLKGVRLSVTGRGKTKVATTDENGVTFLAMTCDPETDMTKFVVDIPGNPKSKTFRLISERGRQVRIVKREVKFPVDARYRQHAGQAFRRGAGDIHYIPQPAPETTLPVSPTAEPEVLEPPVETLPPRIMAFPESPSDISPGQEYDRRRSILVYGLVRPACGLLGFFLGTNNRRSNLFLFIGLPLLIAWWGWVTAQGFLAYFHHPLSDNLANIVLGEKTPTTAYRLVPMHIGPYLLLLGGMLLSFVLVPIYWVAARREEVERSYLLVIHRFQLSSGDVLTEKEPGLVRKFVESWLVQRDMHPAQQPVGEPAVNGTTPTVAKSEGGHSTALTLLTISEVADWVLTLIRMFSGKGGKHE